MKFIRKMVRLVCFTLVLTIAAFGLGINGVLTPQFYREENSKPLIELVENKKGEDGNNIE